MNTWSAAWQDRHGRQAQSDKAKSAGLSDPRFSFAPYATDLLRAKKRRAWAVRETFWAGLLAALSARFPRFAGLTFAARGTFAAFLALNTFWGGFSALKSGFAAFFTRLARFTTGFAGLLRLTRLTIVTLLTTLWATLGTETVAAAAIVAATAEIAFTATVTTIKLLLAFALREIGVGLFAAAICTLGFGLAAFTLAAIFVAFVIVIEAIIVHLLHRHGRLHLADESKIMVSVLHVIFAEHTVPRGRCIAGKLQIAIKDHGGVAAHLTTLGPIALHRPIGMVVSTTATTTAAVVMTAAGLATAASLTLHQFCTIMLWSVVIATGVRPFGPAPRALVVSLFAWLWVFRPAIAPRPILTSC
ncbi:MAG: hypothetical protein M0D54_12205 [Hyphomonadaceae bacterium JAD_PAG50586_4]|nr:MAG: hypothetical protein M0D54_12205 [Hyphomonadaceae bacterium JAD_PAG50586_4]